MVSKPEALPPWGSAVAGATGAVLANSLVYPLDIVKTRIQTQGKKDAQTPTSDIRPVHYDSTLDALTKIIADDGITGLYSGISGALLGVASTNFAYFYWYSVVRTLYESSVGRSKPPNTATELALGALAGAVAQVFTIPVSVITTRQQTQSKHEKTGFVDTARQVIDSEDGISGLWRGLKASLVLVVNPAITYGAYQRLRQLLFSQKDSLRPWEAFFLGALSKSLATIVTQPLIVAKVGLQSKPPPERQGKPFKTFIEVMRFIVAREGLGGLFKGIAPQILKGLLVQGILMTIKERMELVFVVLFTYARKIRSEKVREAAKALKSSAENVSRNATDQVKSIQVSTVGSIATQVSAVAEETSNKVKKILPVVGK